MQEEEKKIALYENFKTINSIDPAYYEQYDVKRGLRNADGTGVVAGLTNIANVHGYVVSVSYTHLDVYKRQIQGIDGLWHARHPVPGRTGYHVLLQRYRAGQMCIRDRPSSRAPSFPRCSP